MDFADDAEDLAGDGSDVDDGVADPAGDGPDVHDVPADAEDVPGEPGDVSGYAEDVPDDPGDVMGYAGDVPDDPGEVLSYAPDVPDNSRDIPDDFGAGQVEPKARPSTGEPRVDAALARLGELEGRPVTEHRAVFEDVHRRLRDVLGELDSRQQPQPRDATDAAGRPGR